MNVVLGSLWRNSAVRVARYFAQVAALRETLTARGHSLRVVGVEGDSTDATRYCLLREARRSGVPFGLLTRNHGGPEYGSTENPARLQALSYVANALLDDTTLDDDVFIYVESDLIWEPEVFPRLMAQLGPGRDVIAPLPMAKDHFYDVWAFRVNGTRFSPFAPFYFGLQSDGLTPMDSVGSCLVMRAQVARHVRMRSGALVEFCANARAMGYSIFCDGRERIHHP